MADPKELKMIGSGVLGALTGGALGYAIFFWAVGQGFYALALPPTLLGLTAGYFARGKSKKLAIICGALGLCLCLLIEWRFRPFVADQSLVFFLTHLHKLQPMTWIMIALGSFFSYWLALGRDS